jgi:hypothetical protein
MAAMVAFRQELACSQARAPRLPYARLRGHADPHGSARLCPNQPSWLPGSYPVPDRTDEVAQMLAFLPFTHRLVISSVGPQ